MRVKQVFEKRILQHKRMRETKTFPRKVVTHLGAAHAI